MKKIRIWKSPWHLAHDYDLMMALEDVADFGLLANYTRRWDEKIRPFPKNASWVANFARGYDLAILNIDQQCTNLDLNKSILPLHMKQAIRGIDPDVPIIWINHGTPVYPETFNDGNFSNNYVSEKLRTAIIDIVGDDLMVVNSVQAKEEWKKGHVIIHGMGLDEWKVSEDKEPRVATSISLAGIGDKYYNRSFFTAVRDDLLEEHGVRLQWINAPGCFNARDIQDYKNFLSKTLVYFNPTFASPMPRSRTEAMLSGCAIVTTPQHGGSEYIKDGYNGVIVPHNNVSVASNVIALLLKERYNEAKEMGKNARKTAEEHFNRERYKNDWVSLLEMLHVL